MTIFGIRIMRERTFEDRIAELKGQAKRWRYEYDQTAQMRGELMTYKLAYGRQQKLLELTVADILRQPTVRATAIRVWPVPMGVDSGVRIEVGVKPETESRER